MKDIHKRVYDYISERLSDGYTPSIREICRDLGIASTSTASRYVNTLVEEGLLEKIDGQNRAIKLAGNLPTRLPVVGTIAAGQPIYAYEDILDYVYFTPPAGVSSEQLFGLKIRGDSMINVGIFDGDVVIIEKTPYVANGEIAAVMVDGEEATVKRFYKENGHYRLQPENDNMEPIYSDDCRIIGRVAGLVRYM
ncbi:MAG: transcriptional repressor LexA [Oscillospiraceae bacterium]|nr:transcriptional repressor LexA [Oscillospiraceae bacterium]